MFDFKGSANQVLGRLERGRPAAIRAKCSAGPKSMLADYGVFTTTPLEDQLSNQFLSQEIQGLESFAIITPCIFLAVAALVLNVLLEPAGPAAADRGRHAQGPGLLRRQVFGHFLKFGLVVGVGGGLLGCGLGWWLARGLTGIYRKFYQFPDLAQPLPLARLRRRPGRSAPAARRWAACAAAAPCCGCSRPRPCAPTRRATAGPSFWNASAGSGGR